MTSTIQLFKSLIPLLYILLIPLSTAKVQQFDISDKLSTEKSAVTPSRNVQQISGSASLNIKQASIKGSYFLYGAEHLKLSNYYFDIPVVFNAAVKKWLNYFLNKGRERFIRYGERAGRYAPILGKILEDHGLPRDLIFLAMAESGFHNKAKSRALAVGPWQFMKYTAKKYGLKINWYIDERKDPIKATVAASRYLKQLFSLFGHWELAAAGYNAGEGRVGRAIRKYKTKSFWKIAKKRYLHSETRNYVPKIMALAIIGKNLESFGLTQLNFQDPLDFEEINVPPNTDIINLSKKLGVSYEELHRLNPELLRWFTPPGKRPYKLKVPVGVSHKWGHLEAEELEELQALNFQQYKIKSRTSTLGAVGRKFRIPSYVLTVLNKKRESTTLKRGSLVKLPFRIGQSRRDSMYADLYEVHWKRRSKRRRYKQLITRGNRKGKLITNPKEFYTVKKGDTLWTVAKKNQVLLDTLIKSNYQLVKNRMIRAGDVLVIR